MNMIGKIRRLRFRDGLTISEICRKTGISRNTVKKWLNAADDTEPKYQRKAKPTLLTPYEERLKGWLETDSRRPKRDRRTGLALFAKLQQEGFTGSYTRVTEYIRRWRDSGGAVAKSAFVPLKFGLGGAFQFDWGVESLVLGGNLREQGIPAGGVSNAKPRNAVRCAYPGLPGVWRHPQARDLRQHEDGGR